MRKIIVAIYSHAELFPPTINAIHELSKTYDEIILLQRAHLADDWRYPPNVLIISQGKLISSRAQEHLPVFKKLAVFMDFSFNLLKNIIKHKPNCILLYDPLALLSFHCIDFFLNSKARLWYHNHDIPDSANVKKFSLYWFAIKAERKIFSSLDIFTLPSVERLQSFPMLNFQGKYFVIPNYPRFAFYSQFYQKRVIGAKIKLIFQGHASACHGLEEIIDILSTKICDKELQLIVKGPCKESYRQSLETRAKKNGVLDKIEFLGVSAYSEVPKVSSECHIGIGIHAKSDIMNLTLGTASNKLYEYAAVGLPILYYDAVHFSNYLKKYKWAVATKLAAESITAAIEKIVLNYDEMSQAAYADFGEELNFEKTFIPVHNHLASV